MSEAISKDLLVRFMVDTSQASKGIDDLRNKVNDANKGKDAPGAKAGGGGGGGFFSNIKKSIQDASKEGGFFTSQLGKMALETGGVVAGFFAIKYAMGEVMKAGQFTENAISKMSVVMGNNDKYAREVYRKAESKSMKLGFNTEDVVSASLAVQKAMGSTGDAFQKNAYGLKKDVISVMSDMAAYSGQSLTETSSMVMKGDQRLMRVYGKAGRDAFKEALAAGDRGSKAFTTVLLQNLEKVTKWQGMAEKQANTMTGMFTRIGNSAGQIWDAISGAAADTGIVTLWSQLKDIVRDIADGLLEFIEFSGPMFQEFGAALGAIFSAVWAVVKGLAQFLWPVIKVVIKLLEYGFSIIKEVFGFLAMVIQKIFSFVMMIADKLGVFKIFETLIEWIEFMILKIKMIFVFVRVIFNAMMDAILAFFSGALMDAFYKIWDVLNRIRAFWIELKHGIKGQTLEFGKLLGNDVSQQQKENEREYSEAKKDNLKSRKEINVYTKEMYTREQGIEPAGKSQPAGKGGNTVIVNVHGKDTAKAVLDYTGATAGAK